MRLYNVTIDVLEYIAFTLLPLLFISAAITLVLFVAGWDVPLVGVAICLLLLKNIYNLGRWILPKLKG